MLAQLAGRVSGLSDRMRHTSNAATVACRPPPSLQAHKLLLEQTLSQDKIGKQLRDEELKLIERVQACFSGASVSPPRHVLASTR